jgi:non-specific serine/threonine protein kinase
MQESLTERELEVVSLIAGGLSNKQIAEELTVEPSTVETHVHHILSKLGLASRVEIATWWVRKAAGQEDP